MQTQQKKLKKAISRELLSVEKQEQKLRQAAFQTKPMAWKTALESKIPPKVFSGLESAFCKGFSLVFSHGRLLIERTYRKEDIQADYAIGDFAVQTKGGRRELQQLKRNARQADFRNLTITTVEGIGLGALGIGMPDIVLFLGNLLKGIYETALHYGFSYDSRQEQLLILKMMETALSSADSWESGNAEVDSMLTWEWAEISDTVFQQQMKATASAFAADMLLTKFIQGLPVVGILGGVANPIYYRKILKYVQLKYQKRYLLQKKNFTSK